MLITVGAVEAQPVDERKNAVYFEFLGNGGAFSLNYEHHILTRWALRIGGGYFALEETDTGEVDGLGMLPVMISYLGPSRPHGLELGLGVAPTITSGEWDEVGILSSDTDIVGTGTIGYRYAPAGGGFLFRAGFTPWFSGEGFTPWGGLSLGYRF